MKKLLIWGLALVILVAIGAVVFYRYYAPKLVAEAIVKEETPSYLPAGVKSKLKKYKKPINDAATDVVTSMKEKGVSIDQINTTIDELSEEDLKAMSINLKDANPQTTEQVFDLIKPHINADFDAEVLRKPFNQHVNMKMIQRAIKQLNNENAHEMDLEIIKSVTKSILSQKYKELSEVEEAK